MLGPQYQHTPAAAIEESVLENQPAQLFQSCISIPNSTIQLTPVVVGCICSSMCQEHGGCEQCHIPSSPRLNPRRSSLEQLQNVLGASEQRLVCSTTSNNAAHHHC